jgi:hypothetical protein
MRTPSEIEAVWTPPPTTALLSNRNWLRPPQRCWLTMGLPLVSLLSRPNQSNTPININYSTTTKPRDLRNATPPKPGQIQVSNNPRTVQDTTARRPPPEARARHHGRSSNVSDTKRSRDLNGYCSSGCLCHHRRFRGPCLGIRDGPGVWEPSTHRHHPIIAAATSVAARSPDCTAPLR